MHNGNSYQLKYIKYISFILACGEKNLRKSFRQMACGYVVYIYTGLESGNKKKEKAEGSRFTFPTFSNTFL